jgi:hypothetical protein
MRFPVPDQMKRVCATRRVAANERCKASTAPLRSSLPVAPSPASNPRSAFPESRTGSPDVVNASTGRSDCWLEEENFPLILQIERLLENTAPAFEASTRNVASAVSVSNNDECARSKKFG